MQISRVSGDEFLLLTAAVDFGLDAIEGLCRMEPSGGPSDLISASLTGGAARRCGKRNPSSAASVSLKQSM